MISIITSVHNQLDMNKLFYETLRRNASMPFELIVVDNHSTDGSLEYFRDRADVLIANTGNFSYPHCQNQGIAVAKYDHIGFFNNDILVSPAWDSRILGVMKEKGLDVASFATNDHLESREAQRRMHKRWKRIKFLVRSIYGISEKSLLRMVRWMYGDFERFCTERYDQFGNEVVEGFSGSCILVTRSALEKVGKWDERLQVADFDLYFRTKERNLQFGDMQPMKLALGVYIHHFQRLTLRSGHPVPFADQDQLIPLEEKWGDRVASLYRDVVG